MWGIVKAKLFYNRNRYRDTWSSWATKDKTSRQLYIALSKAYISMYLKIKQNEVEKKKECGRPIIEWGKIFANHISDKGFGFRIIQNF